MKLSAEQHEWFGTMRSEWLQKLEPSATHLGRHLFDVGPEVPEAAVKEARIFATRHAAIESLPKHGIFAEIGTQTGRFAEFVLDRLAPAELHLFDIEFDTLRNHRPHLAVHPEVQLHLGDSSEQISTFADETFDTIYIDGDHSIDGVRRDATIAIKKIKASGTLVFNDYTVWSPMELQDYGVVPVVNELLASGEWRMIYFALHPMMYCDVAISRAKAAP
jgi:hypothetical protein